MRPVAIAPSRHCSPVYEISRLVIVAPVSLEKNPPTIGIRLPLCRPPNARSALAAGPKL